MTSNAEVQQPEPSALIACTIRREPDGFDLLIEDMEDALGEHWGDLGFSEALMFFNQPEATSLEFISMAIDAEDEKNLALLGEIIAQAGVHGIKVILIAEDVSPSSLHQLLRQGADEFVPYPLPEGELAAAISRIQAPDPEPEIAANDTTKKKRVKGDRNGAILVTHGLAGGVGATTLAVNLAWELCNVAGKGEDDPKVCILDFDLQFGTVATYLDLPRRESVYEMLSDTEAMDSDSFHQAMLTFEEKLHVLTSPGEMLPLDFVSSEDINRILEIARSHFDFVVVDMPKTLVNWTEAVLNASQVYFAVMELDMRSAQNCQRLKRALQAEELPVEKLRYVLNRAPTGLDLNGKQRVKRLGESLGISIELQLPDGGKPIAQAGDRGSPLGKLAAKNPLRKEIAKLAKSIYALDMTAEADTAD
ncbi:AAA family ATPase [Pseudooceanicola sp.]|uniref:AAA family ATPase n=1 Tax=Pseudooceanicola sp. TaxID=1914328 RepID=UPI002607193F|nr:AAA family ATPase [Pseudooceanicola sp.]MDF1856225.1 AAA family ATPase [Pseudooceanicola sp.]